MYAQSLSKRHDCLGYPYNTRVEHTMHRRHTYCFAYDELADDTFFKNAVDRLAACFKPTLVDSGTCRWCYRSQNCQQWEEVVQCLIFEQEWSLELHPPVLSWMHYN